MMQEQDSKRWSQTVRNYFTVTNTKKQWAVAISLLIALTLFYVEYHVLRDRPRWSLFVWNKGIALSATVMIMVSMGMSLLAQLTGCLKKVIQVRRAIGIMATLAILMHIVLSLFFIPRFNLEWYLNPEHSMTILFGTLSTIIFWVMWYYSYATTVKQISYLRLKAIHRLGYTAIFFAILHIIYLGKLPNSIKWIMNAERTYPPPGLLGIYILCILFFGLLMCVQLKRWKLTHQ